MHIPLVFYVLVYNQGCHREGSKVKYKKGHTVEKAIMHRL